MKLLMKFDIFDIIVASSCIYDTSASFLPIL